MSYLPRPDPSRVQADIDEIYLLTADELRRASTPEERKKVFRDSLLRCFEAGVDAMREVVKDYTHEHPTPVPPPPVRDEDATDPGLLPIAPANPPAPRSLATRHRPNEPRKRPVR